MIRSLFFIFFIFISISLLGQTEIEKTVWWQNYLERQAEIDASLELSEGSQLLLELKQHPIVLDSTTIDKLFFLDISEKASLLAHLGKFGKLVSIYELQAIEGVSAELCLILAGLIKIHSLQIQEEPYSDWIKNGHHEALVQTELNLQKAKAYLKNESGNSHYLGNRNRTVLRYRFNYKQQLYYGLSFEKDAGEQFGTANFLTGHLFYAGKGRLKTLAFGDFQAVFGLGLTLASRAPLGKGAQVFQTSGTINGIRPYRALGEFGFMRGAALSFQLKPFSLDLLLSGLSDNGNGLFRTPAEIKKRNQTKNYLLGMHISKSNRSLQYGLIFTMHWQASTLKSWVEPNFRHGIYVKRNIGSALMSAELSGSYKSINALVQALIPLHSKIDYMLLGRRYAPNEGPIFVGAWSEFSGTRNEIGLYQALLVKPSRKLQFSFYQDVFAANKPRYQKELSAKGTDWMLSAQLKLTKTTQWELRMYTKYFHKDINEGARLLNSIDYQKRQVRLQVNTQALKTLGIKARFDYNQWQTQEGTGFFVESNWKSPTHKWSLTARYMTFQSAHDETRVYALEKDLPYQYSLGSFNGVGARVYFLLHYQFSSIWNVHIKIGHLVQADGDSPGSGWDELITNQLTDFSFQLRAQW